MSRLLLLLAAAVATPALAQHSGHGQSSEPPPPPVDPHAAHGAADEDPPRDPRPPQPASPADPHAGHAMPAPPPVAADPHAGHSMPAPPPVAADPHAGHSMPAPPAAAAPAAAGAPPTHAADLFWDKEAMARSRREMREEHGGMEAHKVLIDRLEARIGRRDDGYAWDAEAWYGGDIDKLWIKSEGEGSLEGRLDHAEVQALWSRAIDPFFDLQVGVRYDLRPNPQRAHLVAGVQGLAPYWFEVDAALFLSDRGELSARFEAEYDLRITQKLILQPRTELALALQDVPELATGSGLTDAALEARLRYEIVPQFAPYLGIGYERAFGGTRRYRLAAGEEGGGWRLLLGLRTWF